MIPGYRLSISTPLYLCDFVANNNVEFFEDDLFPVIKACDILNSFY